MSEQVSGWENYSESNDILYLRPDNEISPSKFEFIYAKPAGAYLWKYGLGQVNIDNYPQDYHPGGKLDDILKQAGYQNLDDFVRQTSSCELQEPIDRINDPNYIVDTWLLASIIARFDKFKWLQDKASICENIKRCTGFEPKLEA